MGALQACLFRGESQYLYKKHAFYKGTSHPSSLFQVCPGALFDGPSSLGSKHASFLYRVSDACLSVPGSELQPPSADFTNQCAKKDQVAEQEAPVWVWKIDFYKPGSTFLNAFFLWGGVFFERHPQNESHSWIGERGVWRGDLIIPQCYWTLSSVGCSAVGCTQIKYTELVVETKYCVYFFSLAIQFLKLELRSSLLGKPLRFPWSWACIGLVVRWKHSAYVQGEFCQDALLFPSASCSMP